MTDYISRRHALGLMASAAALPYLAKSDFAAAMSSADRLDSLYKKSIVIDTLSFAHKWDEDEYRAIDQSGYTGIITSLNRSSLDVAIKELVDWKHRIAENPNRFLLALTASDFERAKREGKLAVMMNFQNATMLEGKADNVDALHALGMRCFQLTYNSRNLLGDGSTERTNAGLSDFGIEVVKRMNEVGVIVDVSHSGRQTTMDAIAFSDKPVAFTHTMAEALRPQHPRAKTDEQMRACAAKGGVMGIAGLGYFIGPKPGVETTIETYLDHVDHAINVAGIDHVGLATDYPIRGLASWATRENWYEPRLKWFKAAYDVQWPSWIPELDEPDRFLTVTHMLSKRGYSDAQIEKLLGQNWMRFFRDVFGA